MANKQIPLQDKQLVVQRLAEGQSTRQAIEGTAITSNQTAARLAKMEVDAITQRRREYVAKIDHYSRSGSNYRACMLADMVNATKVVRIGSVRAGSAYTAPVSPRQTYITVPDWPTRLQAIKYIDQLNGFISGSNTQVNVMQQQINGA